MAKGFLVSTIVIPWRVSLQDEWAGRAYLLAASLSTTSNVLFVQAMDLISAGHLTRTSKEADFVVKEAAQTHLLLMTNIQG